MAQGHFVTLDIPNAAGQIYDSRLGSTGSDVACVCSWSGDNHRAQIFNISKLSYTDPFSENWLIGEAMLNSIDRVGIFTVVTRVKWTSAGTQMTLIRDDKKVSETFLSSNFFDFKVSIGVGRNKEMQGIVAIFDLTGREKPEIISEHVLNDALNGSDWDASVLSLSDNTGIIRLSHAEVHLFDSRSPIGVRIRDMEMQFSHPFCQGVIAGCSVFFCSDKMIRTERTSDKILIFEQLRCAGIAPGSAWMVRVNSIFSDISPTIIQMFAWHPAHGALAVVICSSRLACLHYELLIVNPKTLTYVVHPTKLSNVVKLAPGHICGQPVILKLTEDHIEVLA